MRKDIINTIQETLYVQDGTISGDTNIEDITQNSMDLVELISVLRSKYNVSVQPQELDQVTTIDEIVAYVEDHAGDAAEKDDNSLDAF
jgi:acyl carrier protein